MNPSWVGWVSSFVLLGTMGKQVAKQWRVRETGGVSQWLYIGQTLAEVGFVWYSLLVKNWVFVFTNTVLLALNLVGLVVLLRHRRAG